MSSRLSFLKPKSSGGEKNGKPPMDGDGANAEAKPPSPPPAYNDAAVTDGFSPNAVLPPGPPSYGQNDVNVNINAAFSALNLSDTSADPDVDKCLAHLKLLFAIQTMKEDVGYTDGLWQIWDTRAGDAVKNSSENIGAAPSAGTGNPEDDAKALLSRLREKRWAVFLARAVDRYEAWWMALPGRRLVNVDMADREGNKNYYQFPDARYADNHTSFTWDETTLPPLGK
jgi:hypothetical protein